MRMCWLSFYTQQVLTSFYPLIKAALYYPVSVTKNEHMTLLKIMISVLFFNDVSKQLKLKFRFVYHINFQTDNFQSLFFDVLENFRQDFVVGCVCASKLANT